MNQLYLQIIHRIAFVVAVIPAMVIILLPQIYPDEKDHTFRIQAYDKLLMITKGALLVLLISGLLRLSSPLSLLLIIKIILAGTTILSFYVISIEINDDRFTIISYFRVVLMFITGLTGLFI